MKINRRSFLKAVGGLAAVATLPNTPAALPVIPVRTTTIPTVTVQETAKQIGEIIDPVSTVIQTAEAIWDAPITSLPELKHCRGTSTRWLNPVVYINGKQLLAHRMTCRLESYCPTMSPIVSIYNPSFELTIDSQVYGDAAKEQILGYPLETPVDVRIQLRNGMVCKGQGVIAEFYEEHSLYDRTYFMVIPMWDMITTVDENHVVEQDRWWDAFPKYEKGR